MSESQKKAREMDVPPGGAQPRDTDDSRTKKVGSRLVRAALTQTVSVFSDKKLSIESMRSANVKHHLALMESAKAQGVQVIGFGELFAGPYFGLETDVFWKAFAEDATHGPTVTEVSAKARELSLIVVAPIYEKDPSGKCFNTAVVISEKGEVLGKYRKTHIPNGSNEQGTFSESFYYERSDGKNGSGPAYLGRNDFFPVFKTSVGNLGVAICYDRHFEGVMHALKKSGAELVFSPAVTFGEKSQRMWPQEFQVDAARHGLFIGGSNRKGKESPWNQEFFGESHFVGPNGPLVNLSNHPELVVSDLDLLSLKEADPSGWNLPRDRRPEIY